MRYTTAPSSKYALFGRNVTVGIPRSVQTLPSVIKKHNPEKSDAKSRWTTFEPPTLPLPQPDLDHAQGEVSDTGLGLQIRGVDLSKSNFTTSSQTQTPSPTNKRLEKRGRDTLEIFVKNIGKNASSPLSPRCCFEKIKKKIVTRTSDQDDSGCCSSAAVNAPKNLGVLVFNFF